LGKKKQTRGWRNLAAVITKALMQLLLPSGSQEFHDRGNRSLLFWSVLFCCRRRKPLSSAGSLHLRPADGVADCVLVMLCHRKSSWVIKPSEL